MKAILKDIIVNNKKMSQEAYTLTKAYLSDADRNKDIGMFPKLPLKSLPKRLPPAPIGMRERVVLPAIKQSLNSSIAERQKKAQAVLRSRLRRVVQ
ncbi:coiled-coil domain-containing protein 74A-like [Coregonus clupeaformis]|nr:coiled-coil domain-containing protein 74A-like [Coregonus clupeaformis]